MNYSGMVCLCTSISSSINGLNDCSKKNCRLAYVDDVDICYVIVEEL